MNHLWNFASGPSMLPKIVLEQISNDVVDFNSSGISILEIGHRSDYFANICNEAEEDLRQLIGLSSEYEIIFSHAGGHAANAIIPMNIMDRDSSKKVDFIISGHWSQTSYLEAKKYVNANIAANNNFDFYKNNIYYKSRSWMPSLETWNLSKKSSYIHLCSNETVDGIEFVDWPLLSDISIDSTLVVDVSSNFLTRSLNIERAGLLFACAQKNMGVAGLTVIIVKKELLDISSSICPSSFDYNNIANSRSLYSTPPIFAIYVASLMFKWLKLIGGLTFISNYNYRKSEIIYNYLDSTDFYNNNVEESVRSRVNIPFLLKDKSLNSIFLQKAKECGLVNLNGHRSVGGMRVSIYNAMPIKGVLSLINYMRDFERRYG